MSAFATLTLTNSAAANIAFAPASIDSNGVATWLAPGSSLDARPKATMRVSLPKSNGTVARVKQRVTIPVMDTVDTSKKIAEGYVDVEFVFPKKMSETDRLNLKAFIIDMLGESITTDAVQNFGAIY